MTYDYHGAWEPNGPTNLHARSLGSALDPSTGANLNADASAARLPGRRRSSHKLHWDPVLRPGMDRRRNAQDGCTSRPPDWRRAMKMGVNDYGYLKS
jgi:hypothetical protein